MAVISRLGFLVRTTAAKLRHVWARTRTRGVSQGWVCAQTYLVNAWLRVCNKFCSRPRVECPCCGWKGYGFRWVDCGKFVVPRVECPQCMGHERHRMMHLFLDRRTPAFLKQDKAVVLHFAPERHITRFFEQRPGVSGVATDYARSMVVQAGMPGAQADMQALPFCTSVFDGMFCLHVLEHVPDDHKGVSELSRVLKPGGEAVIMVPFMMDQKETIEYPAPDPDMFGHVRGYAPSDFKTRLSIFDYEEIFPLDFMTEAERFRYQIPHDSQAIYLCRKRPK